MSEKPTSCGLTSCLWQWRSWRYPDVNTLADDHSGDDFGLRPFVGGILEWSNDCYVQTVTVGGIPGPLMGGGRDLFRPQQQTPYYSRKERREQHFNSGDGQRTGLSTKPVTTDKQEVPFVDLRNGGVLGTSKLSLCRPWSVTVEPKDGCPTNVTLYKGKTFPELILCHPMNTAPSGLGSRGATEAIRDLSSVLIDRFKNLLVDNRETFTADACVLCCRAHHKVLAR